MLRTMVFVLALGGAVLSAQPVDPRPDPGPPTTVEDENRPVAVPEASALAMDYYRSGNVLWVAEQLFSIALLVALLASGFSAKLRDVSERIGRRWFFVIVVYFVLFNVITTIVELPLAYYAEFVREHAYGLSNQTFDKWARDTLTSLAVGSIVGALFLWVPYLLLRQSPKRWWLYTSLALIPFIVIANLVAPIWIAPLFNTFGPMHDKALEQKVLGLAARAGVEDSRVYEVAKSVDTKTLNAYVAGLFSTKRIVLWDTTLKRMTDREVLVVIGHEMGHYVLNHVWMGLALGVILQMGAFYVAYRTSGAVIAKYGGTWGFSSLADVASFPLLLLLFAGFGLVVTPIELAFQRHWEHEADRFGLEITQTSHSAGTAFINLQEDALANPRPGLLFKIWRASHPPIGERIDFINDYHPWRSGQRLEYGDKFTP